LNAAVQKTDFKENLQPFTFKTETKNVYRTERFLAGVSLILIETESLCKKKVGKSTDLVKSDKLIVTESYQIVKKTAKKKLKSR
jgi:hypothetical protein